MLFLSKVPLGRQKLLWSALFFIYGRWSSTIMQRTDAELMPNWCRTVRRWTWLRVIAWHLDASVARSMWNLQCGLLNVWRPLHWGLYCRVSTSRIAHTEHSTLNLIESPSRTFRCKAQAGRGCFEILITLIIISLSTIIVLKRRWRSRRLRESERFVH